MAKHWDVVIAGAGLYGATCAHELTKRGFRCLVVEKRPHIGGNCYTETRDGIHLHLYGAHIFHTANERIWNWVRQFADFNHYRHTVRVDYEGRRFSFPFNLATFRELWGVTTPQEAAAMLESVRIHGETDTLEGYALSQLGPELYEIFIKGYTQKQWGRPPSQLPASIIKRIPVRFKENDAYFDDPYQGIPIGGYTPIIEKLLSGVEVRTNVDYLRHREELDAQARKILYTGPVDAFCDHRFGPLDYRGMRFEHERLPMPDYQGCSVVNHTSLSVPYTRVIEHRHFESPASPVTWVSREYPNGSEPMYPLRDEANLEKFRRYRDMLNAPEYGNYYFGGRLAEYMYYDMHQAIAGALKMAGRIAAGL